ncbi:MAG: acetamidase/formamidase family protein [Thermoplasmataceae archaeon]
MKRINGHNLKNLQKVWKRDTPFIEEIEEGEEIILDIPDSSTDQVKPGTTNEDLGKMDQSLLDASVGPLNVKGAKPGDLLEVHIHSIETAKWGFSTLSEDFGLLKGRFKPSIFYWKIEGGYAIPDGDFLKGIRIPISPFLGVIATLPSSGSFGMIPPQKFGGNMDNRLNGTGSTVLLPVNIEGAGLSFGDPHACQGDGEVCGTAVETGATVRISVKIVRNRNISSPVTYSTEHTGGKVFCTTGIGPELKTAAIDAVESMIAQLKTMGFKEDESFLLCSVAGNLRISEIVDEPNYVVSMLLPESILRERSD